MSVRSTPTHSLRLWAIGLQAWLCIGQEMTAQIVPPQPSPAAPTAAGSAEPGPNEAVALEPIGRDRIEKVLLDMDRAYLQGDAQAYASLFMPDHLGSHALMRQRLERLTAATSLCRRSSRILVPPRLIGERTVVRVRHEVTLGNPTGEGPSAQFVEDMMMAFRTRPDGSPVPTFCMEIPPQWPCMEGDRFACPPCNYEIGGVPGWLCVPVRGDRANAIESASFFLLGTDIAVDVSVEIDTDPVARSAASVIGQLARILRELDGEGRTKQIEKWLPPAHAAAPPAGFDGARLMLEMPDDARGSGGGRVLLHVVTFGGLQHMLMVRGSAEALREHRQAVADLLASYRLLALQGDFVQMAKDSLAHHTGGICDGNRYRNELFQVAMTGPDGWTAQLRAGGAAFRVVWTGPDGGRLWLTAHHVPAGMASWCRPTSERWVEQMCRQRNLELVDKAALGDWQPAASGNGGEVLELVARSKVHAGLPATQQRWIRVQLHPNLLLVADGHGATAAEEAAVQQALRTLRRD